MPALGQEVSSLVRARNLGGRAGKSGVAPKTVPVSSNLLGFMGGRARKSGVAPKNAPASRNLLGFAGGGVRKSGVAPKKRSGFM